MDEEMDWVQWFMEQQSRNATPEWSISKQAFQPVDIGTLIDNSKYQKSNVGGDHVQAALRDALDPSLFEPSFDQGDVSEPPLTPRYTTWQQSANPVQQLIMDGIREGLDPRMVVKRLTEPGENGEDPPLAIPVGPDGNPDTSEFDYYVKEAASLRDEMLQYKQWEQSASQGAASPSPMAQKFIDDGYSTLPSDRYRAEDFDPSLQMRDQRTQGSQQRWEQSRDSALGKRPPGQGAFYQKLLEKSGVGEQFGAPARRRTKFAGRDIPKAAPQKASHNDALRDRIAYMRSRGQAQQSRAFAERDVNRTHASGMTPWKQEFFARAGL